MKRILNYIETSERIATSGQPTSGEFLLICNAGYETVINLALSTSSNVIANEGDIVTELGMTYVHIPIQWEAPRVDQYHVLANILKKQKNKVWVHCALNMRVSAFMYLYNTLELNKTESEARAIMSTIWEPNETWVEFIGKVKSAHNKSKQVDCLTAAPV